MLIWVSFSVLMAGKRTSHNTECLEVSIFCLRGNINTKSHVSRKHPLYPADFLKMVIYSARLILLTIKNFNLIFDGVGTNALKVGT